MRVSCYYNGPVIMLAGYTLHVYANRRTQYLYKGMYTTRTHTRIAAREGHDDSDRTTTTTTTVYETSTATIRGSRGARESLSETVMVAGRD